MAPLTLLVTSPAWQCPDLLFGVQLFFLLRLGDRVVYSRRKLLKTSCFGGTRYYYYQVFLRRFRDPIRLPRIRENNHRVPTIRENRVPRIREIGSLQMHTGYLTFSF